MGEFVTKDGTVTFDSFCSGFFLTESGAFAMCGHSLNNAAGRGYVVMTRGGSCFPVQAVLAVSGSNDVAIVQVEGGRIHPAPCGCGSFDRFGGLGDKPSEGAALHLHVRHGFRVYRLVYRARRWTNDLDEPDGRLCCRFQWSADS